MSQLYTILEKALKTDSRFVDREGELLTSEIIDKTYKADEKLIELLLSNGALKEKFFSTVKDVLVFKINDFVMYVQDKYFLGNSYTLYKNKIGLTVDGKTLRERKEVALVWPFKDGVLEGGMTKEEERREEIFFNEILEQDEIDKLFAPKVLTKWKRYTEKGEEEVKSLKRDKEGVLRDNLIIKGNNLLALHTLKKQFQGKVKLIYIDPPYNTGSDSFGYNDHFSHSTWLTFMRNRLEAAEKLLTSDGVIAVQCSFHQQAYLKVLMDEIFPKFLATFNVQVRHPDRILTGDKEYNDVIEYIHLYSVSSTTQLPKKEEIKTDEEYVYAIEGVGKPLERMFGNKKVQIFTPDNYKVVTAKASPQLFKKISIRGSIREKNSSGRFYVKYLEALKSEYPPETLFKVPEMGDDAFGDRYFYLPPQGNVNGGYYQGKPQSSSVTYKPYANFLNLEKEYNNVSKQGNVNFRNGKKPEELMQFLIELFTTKDSIMLDYHLGSGTTAATAHKMGRQYIGIEQLDYGVNDAIARLKGVIKGEQTGISHAVEWNGGGDFVYCELMKYNERFIEEIEKAKDTSVLLKIWEDMKEKSFFKHNVDLQKFDESIEEFKSFPLSKQKEMLVMMLNKNQLYVNIGESEDEEFGVNEGDKKLNKEFYDRN